MHTTDGIREKLFALQDLPYRDFQAKLIPTVDPASIIGVRTPALRKLAKELSGTPEAALFLSALPHAYYDENNLHGMLIERLGDYDRTVEAVEAFLPFVDNWATCDLLSPKVFQKHLPALFERIRVWIASDNTYTIRFGVEMLMCFYLDGSFSPDVLRLPAGIVSDEYYVNMGVAWFFATALAKKYEASLPYLEERRLPVWTHNKSIQKAVESYRITDAQKAYLKTLKV